MCMWNISPGKKSHVCQKILYAKNSMCISICGSMLSTHFLLNMCVFGHFTEPSSNSAPAGIDIPAGNWFGTIHLHKNKRVYQEIYVIAFRSRNTGTFNSLFRARSLERSANTNSRQSLWLVDQNLVSKCMCFQI